MTTDCTHGGSCGAAPNGVHLACSRLRDGLAEAIRDNLIARTAPPDRFGQGGIGLSEYDIADVALQWLAANTDGEAPDERVARAAHRLWELDPDSVGGFWDDHPGYPGGHEPTRRHFLHLAREALAAAGALERTS